MGMETISEDITTDPHFPKLSTMTPQRDISSEQTRSRNRNNSIRKIASRAKITRAGTFGSRSSREDIPTNSELDQHVQLASNSAMGTRSWVFNDVDNKGIEASRDGYSSEDSLSAGSDIPAEVMPKRCLPPTVDNKDFDFGLGNPSSRLHPNKSRRWLAHARLSKGTDSAFSDVDEDTIVVEIPDTEKSLKRDLKVAEHLAENESGSRRKSKTPALDVVEGLSQISVPRAYPEKKMHENRVKNRISLETFPEEWPFKNEGFIHLH